MTTRHHYLPRAKVLDSLSDTDRSFVFERHQRDIMDEIDGLKSGYIFITDGKGKAHYLRLARQRLKRLERVARSYGCWEAEAA